MYLLGAATEVTWSFSSTALTVSDLDVITINPEGVEVYLEAPIALSDFTAATAEQPGTATFPITPDIEGLWKLRLVTGTEFSYTHLSKVEMFVLDNTTALNPVAAYLRTQVTSEAIKVPCVVATTANIVLSGLQTINTVAVIEQDRVIVKDQTDATENGIYNVSTSAWTRAKDFDEDSNITNGVFVLDTHEGIAYSVRFAGAMDLGVTEITFEGISISFSIQDLIDQVSYSQEWAQKPEDTHVSAAAGGGTAPEDYSSLHFAAKAAVDADNAFTDATSAAADAALAAASETIASDNATATAVLLANAGSMLGINFGAFTLVNGELIATHLTTTTPSLVDGELILTYETL